MSTKTVTINGNAYVIMHCQQSFYWYNKRYDSITYGPFLTEDEVINSICNPDTADWLSATLMPSQ